MHPAAGELCWALQALPTALQRGDKEALTNPMVSEATVHSPVRCYQNYRTECCGKTWKSWDFIFTSPGKDNLLPFLTSWRWRPLRSCLKERQRPGRGRQSSAARRYAKRQEEVLAQRTGSRNGEPGREPQPLHYDGTGRP